MLLVVLYKLSGTLAPVTDTLFIAHFPNAGVMDRMLSMIGDTEAFVCSESVLKHNIAIPEILIC